MAIQKYIVRHLPQNVIEYSKNFDEIPWSQANVLVDFKNPWSSKKLPNTEFRALWDSKHLYFRFDAKDSSIYINENDNSVESIGASDRVEIFFRKNKDLDPYYCMEIDPKARIMDFKALPNRNFNFEWSYTKEHLNVEAHITEKGYLVEGTVSIKFLENSDLLHNGIIETGIYRAKYIKQKGSGYQPTWITWVDPQTENPDFHTPSSFGLFELEKGKL